MPDCLFLLSHQRQIVNVPEDALVAHFGMFSQEHVRERQSRRIVFEVSKNLALSLRLIFHSQLTKHEHEVVVGAQIFRINRQNFLVALARAMIIMLDLAKLAELLQSHSIPWVGGEHTTNIYFGFVELTASESPGLPAPSVDIYHQARRRE